jgi:hypothetical protein
VININCSSITVDKEKQKQEGIKKLEIELTESGEIKRAYIERYSFACDWDIEDTSNEKD